MRLTTRVFSKNRLYACFWRFKSDDSDSLTECENVRVSSKTPPKWAFFHVSKPFLSSSLRFSVICLAQTGQVQTDPHRWTFAQWAFFLDSLYLTSRCFCLSMRFFRQLQTRSFGNNFADWSWSKNSWTRWKPFVVRITGDFVNIPRESPNLGAGKALSRRSDVEAPSPSARALPPCARLFP